MASGRMEFHAETIMQHTNFSFVLPNDINMEEVEDLRYYERPPKSLILLHGLTGTDTDWLYGGVAQDMAIRYNLAVFMPTCGNYFYLDRGYQGGNYSTFLGEELPAYIRSTFGFCTRKEDTMIAGLSMGGYGALHTAFAYPEVFSSCIALSSALRIHNIAAHGTASDSIMPPAMILDVFGDPSELEKSDRNPEYQYCSLKEKGVTIPSIYMAIGTEDSLYDVNQDFRSFLEEQHADFHYEEGPGGHDWRFWNQYLNEGLSWILNR